MGLLRSKKFQAALVGVVVAALAHFGFDVAPDTVMALLAPILAFIAGQGVADIGKEKAKVEKG